MQQEAARQQIQALVERYQQLGRTARRHYTETATRTDFIDPLFAALGWDMRNNAEVTREESSGRKRVDYAFKINGVTRFLLEAKNLEADLLNPDYARQATDYAWNRGVDWVVLTNFHELKLYFVSEYQRTNPIFSLGHEEFLRHFDELRLLSKDAIRDHKLQKRAVGIPRRQPVDKQLYEDLAGWRRALLANLRQFHEDWSDQEREEATQLILNRLIFIRNVEDREIEDAQLLPMLRQLEGSEAQLPARLVQLFRDLDAIYNAQLFARHFCEDYEGPAEPLVNMARGLNHRVDRTPYDFAAIGADVLGTIYEQYLTLAQAEQERRKQQGIYYTPLFVVRYIVRNTVVKALEAARERGGIAAARRIRVLDPACGSGSFLIAAFDVLNDWLRDNDPTLREASRRKQHILHENLYGVDKDPQAVAVTRLNLWLRAVDRRARLPDIPNIREGDSLVDEEFDWPKEYPAVMETGGFDVVIGNPPYVRQESLDAKFKEYARAKYRSYTGRADLYVCFYERAHELLRPGGYFGFVSSNKFMRAAYGKGLREYLLEVARLEEIIDFGRLPVFEGVAAYPSIVITRKADSRPEEQEFIYAPVNELPEDDLDEAVNEQHSILDKRSLVGDSWALAPKEEMDIFLQMRKVSVPLAEYMGKNFRIYLGTKTGFNEAFIIGKGTHDRIVRQNPQSTLIIHRVLGGKDIQRFTVSDRECYLINIPKGWTRENCGDADPEEWMRTNHPALMQYLEPFEERARHRRDKGEFWWELRACTYLEEFHKNKIVYPEIARESRFTLDAEGYFLNNKVFFIPVDDTYMLGVLNSSLVFRYFKHHSSALGGGGGNEGGWLEWRRIHVSQIPIPHAAADDPWRHTIERAVQQALDLAPHRRQTPSKVARRKFPCAASWIDSTSKLMRRFARSTA